MDQFTELSITDPPPASTGDSEVPLKNYFFKPKGGDYKLILVVAPENEDIGKASTLAKSLGVKDMRAAEEEYIIEWLGEGRATGP